MNYPIYNIVTACIYKNGTPTSNHKGAKSYGVRDHGDVEVRVGTSSSNSFSFVEHSISHRLHDDGSREYRFKVDGKVIKTGILKKGADMLEVQA